ncbi:MAG: osmotically inducible protein C [Bacteroidetes bacterium CG_4_10_14_3_um_filter_31_20]|nr:MAG: osmotically inducible protein C [Bacteroidetes bacterium CG_4_8_14_3_um_filter_31_14]PIY02293.1 MAG: osmotically inducible protein C [Bacteroidetes bacterium CG_4_10_14_3_um_filter_31_20]
MKHSVKTSWKNKMTFVANVNGHNIQMDAMSEFGGEDSGPRPKELMLAALAGCTGMDIISILAKMQVKPTEFNINVEADMTEEHPKHYYKMHIVYEFKGENLPIEKLNRAVELSQEKYCGVSAVYKKTMEVSYEIKILN